MLSDKRYGEKQSRAGRVIIVGKRLGLEVEETFRDLKERE